MRGHLRITSELGRLRTHDGDGRFVVRADVVLDGEDTYTAVLGQSRANAVARAFERELNAANLAVVRAYVHQHVNGTLTVLTAARILDRAGVRP